MTNHIKIILFEAIFLTNSFITNSQLIMNMGNPIIRDKFTADPTALVTMTPFIFLRDTMKRRLAQKNIL